jgi:outer membrane murein-binding lipoprotein Lpp
MRRTVLTLLLFSAPLLVGAADDLKVSQLEQSVLNLQREVSALSQQLDELRRQIALTDKQPAVSLGSTASSPLAPANKLWLDAARWKQVKAGMGELDVIGLLGPPASTRVENQVRLLLYGMEIGGGFLAGNVALRDRVVIKVEVPVLR